MDSKSLCALFVVEDNCHGQHESGLIIVFWLMCNIIDLNKDPISTYFIGTNSVYIAPLGLLARMGPFRSSHTTVDVFKYFRLVELLLWGMVKKPQSQYRQVKMKD